MAALPAEWLSELIQQYAWPFLRISSVFMVVPVFGMRSVPARVRILLAVVLTVIVAPLLPAPEAVPTGSLQWFETLTQQMLIGLGIGFVLLLVFESVLLGGEIIAYGMGLGFAQLADPLRGVNTPVVGQFLSVFVTLLFLSLNGAAWLTHLIVESFALRPIGSTSLTAADGMAILKFAGTIYSGGLTLALPIMVALLWINLALGVISRSAPALNLFAVGFPVTLMSGLLLIYLALPSMAEGFAQSLFNAVDWLRSWLRLG